MKLRIKGNSVRLRLQRSEVTKLVEEGWVEERLQLGPDTEQVFLYRLETGVSTEPTLAPAGLGLKLSIPQEWAQELLDTDRVGFDTDIATARDVQVRVVIEKDFQCLVERPGEDDTDAYDHPEPNKCAPRGKV